MVTFTSVTGCKWTVRKDGTADVISADMEQYLRRIESGKEPAPYTVEFRDCNGRVVSRTPQKTTNLHKTRLLLFGE